MMVQISTFNEEVQLIFEVLKTCCETYSDFYENAREAYVSFVNFAPSVQS